ncbi:thiamine pyrophosphate-binding protein [Allopusillimonas ginsengisoli]|uniref:thiamine pyrophosphate-binding protein n=1 Tax=Allopusillimonas ginsengisoli TaxID=453575 RepID=UPI00101EFC1C|nr:thiamine pyrophosphate-binding protein [Allopusillimonas ginsengisoli]TEA78823.1 thiamine pyrophosphate-binding protein [Allopusillimonas ginsengisoli]
MSKEVRTRNGGQIVIDHLRLYGVKRVFMVAGESYLPCIDALYDHQDAIQAIACRQEAGAAYMAEAHGKLTGKPGVCFVTRGPGATNASIGVHTAYQDSTPMILFVGQVDAETEDRDAFQEIDYRRMFGAVAKWVAQVDCTERLPEYLARAFAVAVQGRPGPVVLALPEQVLWGKAAVEDVLPMQAAHPSPMVAELNQMQALLDAAKRPFLLLGGNGWRPEARQTVEAFAERFQLPVGVGWRRQECFDNRHPNYAGHVGYGLTPELAQRITTADLVIALGSRLNQPTTVDYTLLECPQPKQKLIHIYPDGNELGRVYRPTLPILADVHGFAAAVSELQPLNPPDRVQHVRDAHAHYLNSLEPLSMPGPMNLNEAASIVAKRLPKDACVTAGAGNFALFPHRYIQFSSPGIQLSPILGAMGYGLPAAIAAKLEHPEKVVVCYAGDGCFQMNMQELGTAMQQRLGIVVLLFNNSTWGTIRMHQEREFPGRTIGLGLSNPDFAAIVRAYGGHGETVTHTEDFSDAFDRCIAFAEKERLPALIEIQYDVEGITPETTLSAIRDTAIALQNVQ